MAAAPHWSLAEAIAETSSIDLNVRVGAAVDVPAVVIEPTSVDDPAAWRSVTDALAGLAVVVVSAGDHPAADVAGDPDDLVTAVHATPQAATVAAQLLRHLPVDATAALVAESLAYATLQSGAEHTAWIERQGRRVRSDTAPRVRLEHDEAVTITFTRPRLHNLLDRQARDELTEALRTAALLDDAPIVWRAEGPSFCAGGDPAEFGTVRDPATAHLIRSAASPTPAVIAVADRLTAEVHGACVGAGVELAAYASRVVAAPDTRFRLPECSMGLIPGVGGTWSISRRIGRRRLLRWLLLDLELDAPTALEWGLIDTIDLRE